MAAPTRGRRPGAPDTRAAVLAAARSSFAEKGFRGTTIRAVASEAGVDPALVHHYFGTKDDLFLAAMELPVDPREFVSHVTDGPVEAVAERFLVALLGVWDDPTLQPALLAAARRVVEPGGERLFSQGFLPVVIQPIGAKLGLDRPEHRMSLVASQVMGLILMRAVVGVQKIESGRVEILDQPAGSKPLRDRVGYLTQAASVYDDLSVAENLRFFARVLGVTGSIDRVIEEAVTAVDLTDHSDQVVGSLSGGQRSRASLAVALLGEPDVLVLDEPTVGLDPVLRRDLWALFHRLADDGTAVLVSSHVMDEAERCDRLLLMRGGQIIANGSPAEIRGDAHDIEAAFLRIVEGSAA